MSPSEMRGVTQQSNMGIGSLGGRAAQGLSGNIGGFGGLEGAQQVGGQSQGVSMEQAPMGESERNGFRGALEAGSMGQEVLGQTGLGQTGLAGGGGLSESAVSRMTESSLGGRTGESLQGIQGMQGVQDIQGMQGMQNIVSPFTGGQQGQGGMLSEGGGISSLQGQGMMGASLQGGLQGMLGATGGTLAGLQGMGGGGDLGQQQMAFKKVS